MPAALNQMTVAEARGNCLDDLVSGGGATFNAAIDALNLLKSGTATIALGNSSVTVLEATIGTGLGGKPAHAIMMGASDTTMSSVDRVEWSGNDLVIHGDANTTAAVTVAWFVDGRP